MPHPFETKGSYKPRKPKKCKKCGQRCKSAYAQKRIKPHTRVYVIPGCPWCKPYKQFHEMLKKYRVKVITCNRTNSNAGGCFRARGYPHVEGKLKRQTLENIIYRYRRNGRGPKNWMK